MQYSNMRQLTFGCQLFEKPGLLDEIDDTLIFVKFLALQFSFSSDFLSSNFYGDQIPRWKCLQFIMYLVRSKPPCMLCIEVPNFLPQQN